MEKKETYKTAATSLSSLLQEDYPKFCQALLRYNQMFGEEFVSSLAKRRIPGLSRSSLRRAVRVGQFLAETGGAPWESKTRTYLYREADLWASDKAKNSIQKEAKQLAFDLGNAPKETLIPREPAVDPSMKSGKDGWVHLDPIMLKLTDQPVRMTRKLLQRQPWLKGQWQEQGLRFYLRSNRLLMFLASIPEQIVDDEVRHKLLTKLPDQMEVPSSEGGGIVTLARSLSALFDEVRSLSASVGELKSQLDPANAIPIGGRATLVPLIDKEEKGFSASSIADEMYEAYKISVSLDHIRNAAAAAGLIGDTDYGYYSEHHTSAFGASGAHWRFNAKGRTLLWDYFEPVLKNMVNAELDQQSPLSATQKKNFLSVFGSMPKYGKGTATKLTLAQADIDRFNKNEAAPPSPEVQSNGAG